MSILIVFDKSNSSEDSRRLAHVFSDRDFRQSLDKEYALVYIDLADTADAKENVKDADRNRQLRDQFQVGEYPTVLMTDEEGQVMGFLGGFQKEGMGNLTIHEDEHEGDDEEGGGPSTETVFEGGAQSFQRMFKQWHEMGTEIRKATEKIKSLSAGEDKNKAIGKLLDLLELNDLDRFYQTQITEWKALLPEELCKHRWPSPAMIAASGRRGSAIA